MTGGEPGSLVGTFRPTPWELPMIVTRRRPRWLPDPEQGESTFVGDLLRSETVGGSIALVGALVEIGRASCRERVYSNV